jgi:transcriptional regulator with XRE-family HTH domain
MTSRSLLAPSLQIPCSDDNPNITLSVTLSRNLRQIRQARGFSLERLSKISQVSRAMLNQIETGKSAPTINTVGRIARALRVSIAMLLTTDMPETTNGKLQVAPIAPAPATNEEPFPSRVIATWRDFSGAEVHELSLARGAVKTFAPASEGIKKSLIVTAGTLSVEIDDKPAATLSDGDAVIFCASQSHALRNLGSAQAKALLVTAGVDMFNCRDDQSLARHKIT